MEVLVLGDDKNLRKMWVAARTCYSKKSPIELYQESLNKSDEQLSNFINKVFSFGHLSISEHCNFTCLISGVSRSLTHQLVRHRPASYSQQSQRYCNFEEGFDYIIPDKIKNNEELKQGFDICMKSLQDIYNIFINAGVPQEDARAILPNACSTNIVVTFNLRELIHICNERLCTCAQLEIRKLFNEIKRQVIKQLPLSEQYLVPKCDLVGFCNESKERCCGRHKTKNELNV